MVEAMFFISVIQPKLQLKDERKQRQQQQQQQELRNLLFLLSRARYPGPFASKFRALHRHNY